MVKTMAKHAWRTQAAWANYFSTATAFEIPRSGSKAKNGEKRKREQRLNNGDNNGQARMAHASRLGQLFIFVLIFFLIVIYHI